MTDTTKWTASALEAIDAALRDAGRKIVEIDDGRTQWHVGRYGVKPRYRDGRYGGTRYAVCNLNVAHKRGDRSTYVTDVNAERIVKGERRDQWHAFVGLADTLAEAVIVALPERREYAAAWHLANDRRAAELEGPVVTVKDVRTNADLEDLDPRKPVDPRDQNWTTHAAECDGYGAIHAPTVEAVQAHSWQAGRTATMYRPACVQGCSVGSGHLSSSRETALAMYPRSHSRTDRCDGSCMSASSAPTGAAEPAQEAAATDDVPVSDGRKGTPAPAEPVATVTPIRKPAKPASTRMTKAERKAWNRQLAAEVRALGLVPNGDVWERAKQLKAAGQPVTRELVAA